MKDIIYLDMGDYIDSVIDSIAENGCFELSGQGTSMYPFIKEESDTVILERVKKSRIRVGEIYLYKRPTGGYAIHRVYAVQKSTVSMLGDSQYFIEKGVKKSDLLALASGVKRLDKTVDCTSLLNVFKGAFRARLRILFFKLRRFVRTCIKKIGKNKEK